MHSFFIRTKVEDDKNEETRFVCAPSTELKSSSHQVKWMESIRTLSTIYKRRDMYSTPIGFSENYRSQLMINCRKILDHTCKLVGVIKALLGDRSKVKVDPVVIFRDTGVVGSTAVRVAGSIIKVLDDPFTAGSIEPMEIAIKQLKMQVEKVVQHAIGSSNKGAAEYNMKQISKFCDEMLKLDKPSPPKEMASVFEGYFVELDKLFTDSTQLVKQTAIVKLHKVEDKTDELRNAIKEANVYTDAEHQRAVDQKHRIVINHIGGLIKLLESEWDASPGGGPLFPQQQPQSAIITIPGVDHRKSRLMPLPASIIIPQSSSPSASSSFAMFAPTATAPSTMTTTVLPPPPPHPRTNSNPPAVANVHGRTTSNASSLPPPPPTSVRPTTPVTSGAYVSQPSQSASNLAKMAADFTGMTLLDPTPEEQAAYANRYSVSGQEEVASYDEYGNFAGGDGSQYYDPNSYQNLVQYDEYGNPIYPEGMEPVQYDEYGNPIEYDQNGNPILYNEYGNPIYYDEHGNVIPYDENGNPYV